MADMHHYVTAISQIVSNEIEEEVVLRNRSNGDVLQPRLRCGDNGQVRTKRLIGEQRFPNAWCELFNFAVGVDGDPLKHINEVGVRVDVL